MNHSTEISSFKDMDLVKYYVGTAVACVILGLSFLVGAPGNLLVIWTILRYVKQRSHTVLLILHLAAADLLVLITLPLWIYSLVYTWVLGEAFCKILVYIVNVCMFSSIFFITLISVERFLAICHPFVMMRWRITSMRNRYLVLLWLLALLLGLPLLLINPWDGADGTDQCFSREFTVTQEITILCLQTLGGFVVPFIIISICYCLVAAKLRKMHFNSKLKSMVLVHTVVIVFILCWLPYHIINIVDLVCLMGKDTEKSCVPESIVYSSGALVFISSSVNPVLYAFFARNLQGSLEESKLVRLFQEITTHTNKLKELVIQHQTGQGAANAQIELMSDCEKTTITVQSETVN